MSDPHAPPWSALAIAAGALALLALWQCFARLRRDRLVADTPEARIRSAAQGYVRVSGRALPAGSQPSPAPLSARPCVWWAYEIAARERDSRGRASWRTVERAASVELFALVDDDGARCLVGPVCAEVTPTLHDVWYGGQPRPTGPPPVPAPWLPSGSWRYTERLLGVGVHLCVMGELRSHSELGDVAAAAAQRLHRWKEDQPSLLARFDVDHDGRLEASEWDAARAAAAREAQAELLASPIARESVISQPANGEPFIITPLHADALERRERLFAALYFALAMASALGCAWALRLAAVP